MSKQLPFEAELLTSTQHTTAEQKARFGNALVRFVMGGFQRDKFTASLYRQLSNCFGHIAHYDRGGFYDTWFADSRKQMDWVKHVLGHVSMGSPEFTFVDVERLFKSWLALNKQEVEEVILRNLQGEEDALHVEERRVTALQGRTSQQFKVAGTVPGYAGFGHTYFVMVAQDGTAWKVAHIQSNGRWTRGQVFDVPLDANHNPTWAGMSVECPERLKDAPASVIAEVWNGEAA